ncbi:hypothetical protein [Vulcanisaeta sp. JCM 16159]|uniref:hypothetical protein n=1 Tax=Vulcanisaeta sp. JCM 16159 TaxID=1295371 RepID=UPI001FB3E542|nr:hypothetical protein [Vulcanisaeta sp. JCM 16159]
MGLRNKEFDEVVFAVYARVISNGMAPNGKRKFVLRPSSEEGIEVLNSLDDALLQVDIPGFVSFLGKISRIRGVPAINVPIRASKIIEPFWLENRRVLIFVKVLGQPQEVVGNPGRWSK